LLPCSFRNQSAPPSAHRRRSSGSEAWASRARTKADSSPNQRSDSPDVGEFGEGCLRIDPTQVGTVHALVVEQEQHVVFLSGNGNPDYA
jgi:hypothetical protein